MLTLEKDREYIVYPSWAKFPYSWDRLPEILSDPRKSGFMPANPCRDYPTIVPRIEYLDGPAGGGVIVVHQPRHPKPLDIDHPVAASAVNQWWGTQVLVSEANLRLPGGRALVTADPFSWLVTYLEPYENPPEAQLGLRPRPKLYICGATPEHAESAGNSVFWLASLEKRKRKSSALAEIPGWASAFGLFVTELPESPEQLRIETTTWFRDSPEFDDVWYQVSSKESSAGFHFAILVYIALHARSVVKNLRAMHLVGNIEGKPQFRKTWHRR
jgi:hypothetical protein